MSASAVSMAIDHQRLHSALPTHLREAHGGIDRHVGSVSLAIEKFGSQSVTLSHSTPCWTMWV